MFISKTPALLFAFLFFLNSAALAQPSLRHEPEELTTSPMRIERVKEDLYLIRGPITPCMLYDCSQRSYPDGLNHESGDVAVRLTPQGIILIDTKFPVLVEGILEQVRSISTLPIMYVLNTHHHGDHASGNAIFQSMGVNIVGHKNIRENFLRIEQAGEPNIVFEHESSVFLGGVEVRLLHFGRGHTNGDTVIYFPDLSTVHTGDLIVDGMPVIDYSAGGSAVEFIQTLDALLEIDFDTAIPGHGRLMNKADVVAYKYRFEEMNRRMQALAQRGVPKEQVLEQLRLEELGWDNTVSTATWLRSIETYYDEMAMQ